MKKEPIKLIKEVASRLLEIRKQLGFSQTDFAKKIDLSRTYLSSVENSQQGPSFQFLVKLSKNVNISIDWLFTGEGQMFMTENQTLSNLPEIYIKIIEELESKSPEKRSQILQLILNAIELAKKDIS